MKFVLILALFFTIIFILIVKFSKNTLMKLDNLELEDEEKK